MMQTSEIEKRLSTIESSVQQIKRAVQSQANLPRELQECVQQLDQKTSQTKQALQSKDEQRIVQCVDDLEQTSDRAKQSCAQGQDVDENVRKAIMQAHDELSSLKHQLH